MIYWIILAEMAIYLITGLIMVIISSMILANYCDELGLNGCQVSKIQDFASNNLITTGIVWLTAVIRLGLWPWMIFKWMKIIMQVAYKTSIESNKSEES